MDINKNGDILEINFNTDKPCAYMTSWAFAILPSHTQHVRLQPLSHTAPLITIDNYGTVYVEADPLPMLSELSKGLLAEFPIKKAKTTARKKKQNVTESA